MSCDVGEVTERLENELCFTYGTTHSRTLPSLYLRHRSFSNLSIASPASQLILQPFFRFSYVTGSSLMSPGEAPMGRWKNPMTLYYSLYQNFVPIGRMVWKLLGMIKTIHSHTHVTYIHLGPFYVYFFFYEKSETRLRTSGMSFFR